MRKIHLLLALIFLLAGAAVGADLALVGGKTYPAPGAPPINDSVVVVQSGRITTIGPRGQTRIPAGAEVLDCTGLTITAGFWNSHVHLLTPTLLHADGMTAPDLRHELEKMMTRWGFTTVFDLASVLDNTLAIRRRIESGEVPGPRVLTVGEPIWSKTPIYVRDFLQQAHIDMPGVSSPQQAVTIVRGHVRQGVDGIKLFTVSVQGKGKVAVLPLKIAKAAVGEAHRRGLPVFAHPQSSEGIAVALASGVDILAHTAPDTPPWTPDFIARLKHANMALIPTLTLFDFEARNGGDSEQEREHWISKMVDELRAYSQAGGEILFGTDVGYTDHFDTAMEFELMRRAGMNFPQILAALTTNPAHRFKSDARSGRVARGMDADLVVLNADPAQDVTNFSRVRYTIRAGRIIYDAASSTSTASQAASN